MKTLLLLFTLLGVTSCKKQTRAYDEFKVDSRDLIPHIHEYVHAIGTANEITIRDVTAKAKAAIATLKPRSFEVTARVWKVTLWQAEVFFDYENPEQIRLESKSASLKEHDGHTYHVLLPMEQSILYRLRYGDQINLKGLATPNWKLEQSDGSSKRPELVFYFELSNIEATSSK